MGPGLVALFAALGAGGWTYSKLQQRSGYGNSQSALTGTAIVAIITFIVVFTIGQTIFRSN